VKNLQTHPTCSLQTLNNNTIDEGTTNSEHAEFIFLTPNVQVSEPEKFNEAWFHTDPEEQYSWRNAIEKELGDMHLRREIWDKMVIQDIPEGRKLIGSKWVFKKKKNSIYRAHFCALGYNQVPSIDYTE
jgi:hypothetical protein